MKPTTRYGAIATLLFSLLCPPVMADSIEYINTNTSKVLDQFKQQAEGADAMLDDAAGVLVFPDIFRLGFGLGGQYGEGVLLVKGKPVAYYTNAGHNYGLDTAQHHSKSEVIVFRDIDALNTFRNKSSWKVGENGNVTLPKIDAAKGVELAGESGSVLGFVISDKGVVPDVTLDGNRYTRNMKKSVAVAP
ncbi:hypothetical protein [Haliea sp. E17]|uniref:lipid-binding SYLF domain-containing protein n=1 Tax=Haliea sp. E17 TaxID=3401576 RepID=UPI003AAAA2F2